MLSHTRFAEPARSRRGAAARVVRAWRHSMAASSVQLNRQTLLRPTPGMLDPAPVPSLTVVMIMSASCVAVMGFLTCLTLAALCRRQHVRVPAPLATEVQPILQVVGILPDLGTTTARIARAESRSHGHIPAVHSCAPQTSWREDECIELPSTPIVTGTLVGFRACQDGSNSSETTLGAAHDAQDHVPSLIDSDRPERSTEPSDLAVGSPATASGAMRENLAPMSGRVSGVWALRASSTRGFDVRSIYELYCDLRLFDDSCVIVDCKCAWVM
eukprot:2554223-Pleurochrysis_carterae.AAC.9